MSTEASQLDVRLALESAEDPHVIGRPLRWLQLEGLALLIGALLLFATAHQPWWLVPATILVPDLAMAGYLGGTRLGALAYNIGHSTVLPSALALIGVHTHRPLVLAFGLLWLAHIGMDRALTYGLKYDTGFKHTHLGDLTKH
jgi:hypothetical protein